MQPAKTLRPIGMVLLGLVAVATAPAGGRPDEAPVIRGFAGPLSGLSTNHRGELLVADQSVGIVPIRHGKPRAPIPLPGVTDMSVSRFGSTIRPLPDQSDSTS